MLTYIRPHFFNHLTGLPAREDFDMRSVCYREWVGFFVFFLGGGCRGGGGLTGETSRQSPSKKEKENNNNKTNKKEALKGRGQREQRQSKVGGAI